MRKLRMNSTSICSNKIPRNKEGKINGTILEFNQRPAIAAVVYWTINVIKHAVGENEKFKRCIPLIATALGIVCGIICFYALPSIIPAPNIVVAIVIGGASGLTATGTNQIIKQLGKKDDKDDGKTNN